MHVVSNHSKYAQLRYVVERLISDYGVSKDFIFDGVTSSINDLTALDMVRLAKNLNVHCFNLLEGNVCLDTISSQISQDQSSIPDYLLNAAYSSTTSLKSLLEEAQKVGRKSDVLSKLQINETFLSEHKPLSVLACRNALEEIKHLLSVDDLKNIGVQNARKFCDGELGKRLKEDRKSSTALESFIYHSGLVERNWKYKITKQTSYGFFIESTETEQLLDEIRRTDISTEAMNIWRWSFLEEVLRYATDREVHCEQIGPIGVHGKSTVHVSFS